jgi:hypothetical protein
VDAVERSIGDLIDQYKSVRREMRSGPSRTCLMNEITAKIRAYAIVALPLLPSLTQDGRAGERLAAICILQVKPDAAHWYWLVERVRKEDQAFLLYHASLAVLALVKANPFLNQDAAARTAIRAALNQVGASAGARCKQSRGAYRGAVASGKSGAGRPQLERTWFVQLRRHKHFLQACCFRSRPLMSLRCVTVVTASRTDSDLMKITAPFFQCSAPPAQPGSPEIGKAKLRASGGRKAKGL